MDIEGTSKRVLRIALEHGDERDSVIKATAITAALECGDANDVFAANTSLTRTVAMQRSDGNLSCADTGHGITSGHVRSFTPLASLTSSLGYKAVNLFINDAPGVDSYSFMAKIACCDASMVVATDAVQLHGGHGYLKKSPAERIIRDEKITQLYDDSDQVIR